MPMPLDERKKGAVISVIMKKLRKSDDYDDLKHKNEEQTMCKKMEDGAEVEYAESGLEAAAEEILSAIKSENPKQLLPAIRSLVMMIVNEYDD